MLTLLIALAAGGSLGYWAYSENWHWGWIVCCTFAGVLITQLLAGFLLRGAVKRRQDVIQDIMMKAQQKINAQLNLFQIRPPSGVRSAQQMLEKIQNDAARKALEETEKFKSLFKWNLMLKRQIAAMQAQLCFQLKDFKRTDEYLAYAMFADQQTIAVQLVRYYRNNDKRLDSFYRARCRRMKGDAGAFLASVYGWIKLKQDDAEAALAALVEAKKNSDHPVLMENYNRLVNGKSKHYTNSGFGDIWYALYLEEPKVKPQRQRQGRPF